MASDGNGGNDKVDDHQLSFARSYQIEALEQAIKKNTIVFLETGSGKTLIAIMLLRRYAYLLRKPSPFIAVFLVPTVVLVKQQAEYVRKHLDLKVEEYWGEKGVDFWNAADWMKQRDENQLLVMTPDILRNALRHRFLTLDVIKVLIFDECHNAKKNHAYAIIMKEFYHCRLHDGDSQLPRILGMTASPIKAKGFEHLDEQVQYMPPQLVGRFGNDLTKLYYFYSIALKKSFDYDIPLQDIVLGVNTELELDNEGLSFDLEVDRGSIAVSITYIGTSLLTPEQVTISYQFQMTVLRVLLDHSITKLKKSLEDINFKNNLTVFDYILFPSMGLNKSPSMIDWVSVHSVTFPFVKQKNCSLMGNNHHRIHTINGLVCSCLLENALVYTPHNSRLYCTTRRLNGLNGNSYLKLREGEAISYKSYYKTRYDIDLLFEEESFFAARQLFVVRNNLQKGRHHKEKETSNAGVELPSELCYIIMSPISVATFYTLSFVPSIMHRIESWLIALNLKKMHLDRSQTYGNVPATKVLEAITTKKCLEKFHLESYETLGDSFLKYAASQQLFRTLQDQHEGILSTRREKIISNDALCRLGCNCNLPGFIRSEPFDPKTWVVPGDLSGSFQLKEVTLTTQSKVYIGHERRIKKKVVADVVEALIGVFLSEGGEMAALYFMNWVGINVDLVNKPYIREVTLQPKKFINVEHLENLLNYSFRDASLLVEALTHGSYMVPEVPRCYQRLEFLGDAVLDFLITIHLHNKHPGMSPGMLTDLRSASVNNDCYAQSAVKVELHKHILHGSQDLHRHIVETVCDVDRLTLESTFGWESETSFPKVLGDVIESLAGAILVDSGYNKDQVFKSIRPLLEPLVTPEALKLHPVKELNDLCQKNHYELKKQVKRTEDGTLSFTIEVQTEGQSFKESFMARDKKMAERLASKRVLKIVKEKMSFN